MTRALILIFLLFSLRCFSQSVEGYWYGNANVKNKSSASNYLIELILNQNKTQVNGILNYYFKNTFRSLAVNGNYNPATRELIIMNVPITYYGSNRSMEIDCIMNFIGKLRVSKQDARLTGHFEGNAENKYACIDINFSVKKDSESSKKDSILNAIRQYKETYQFWKPTATDTLAPVNIVQQKIVNYVVQDQVKQRENVVAQEISVSSDSLKIDFYDNGEIDGDSISVFFNNELLASNRKLSTRAIHFDLLLDTTKEVNELTMFADNLGSIPPNTALMLVNDGKKRFEIRLSSNLEKNATIRIRRNAVNKAKTE
ncbi:MAG: hypothetical protein QM764_09670 [Chitinophagaceae bacterium]